MLEFIQKLLRNRLLEGRLATHTPSNPRGSKITASATNATITRMENKIFDAMTLVQSNPNYGSVYDGDGIYQVDLYPNGGMVGRPTSLNAKREAGTFNDSGYRKKRSFFVKACTRIQHPDQPEKTCTPVGKSPMDDAVVKVLAYFKDDIIEFIRLNVAGEDEYTVDDKNVQQNDYLTAMKKERKDAEKEQLAFAKKNPIQLSPMEEKIALRKYAEMNGISMLNIDFKTRNEILRKYQEEKSI